MNKSYRDSAGNIIDYYEVLQVPYMAEKEAIRSAFCGLIKMYHPDIVPDRNEKNRDKTELIIRSYKVLIGDDLRKDYNKYLFNERRYSTEGYVYLNRNRIKYSISLKDLVETRLLNKKIKRRDRLYKFGQDIEIFLTPKESETGAVGFIDLPSRTNCFTCYGEDQYCHSCNGLGRIQATSKLEIKIKPNTEHNSFIDVDLIKLRPDRFTTFAMSSIRIKISIIGKKPSIQ